MGGMAMVWEDLTVKLPTFGTQNNTQNKKLLLNGLTGFAQPGKIMAIMGPSGCGKTTFLDSLAGWFLSHLELKLKGGVRFDDWN
ncbi:hypothetical protein RIF29_39385 [Crotalaria pallida]|uniref:ABC transporter domain-containing protein n=1 Tax=Crotalaria pallida TaxID=3830 RepID=A0AAN9HPR2_CROPI